MKTELPDSVFPRVLDENNRISTRYITTTLFPQVGPQTAIKVIKAVISAIDDIIAFQAEIAQLGSAVTESRWREIYDPLGPIALGGDPAANKWQRAFDDLNAYKLGEVLPQGADTIPGAIQGPVWTQSKGMSTRTSRPGIRRSVKASGFTITESGLISLAQERPSDKLAGAVKQLAGKVAANQSVGEEELQKAIEIQKDFLLKLGVIEFLLRGGWLGRNLVKAGLLGSKQQFVSKTIFDGNKLKVANTIGAVFKQLPTALSEDQKEKATSVVTKILERRYKGSGPSHPAMQILKLRMAATQFSAIAFTMEPSIGRLIDAIARAELPDLDDYLSAAAQREWAFLRSERLDLNLGEPTLRGPVQAESLPPLSSLTLKDETSTASEQVSALYESILDTRQQQTSLLDARKLEGLVEQSTYSESDYGDTETLFRTLTEQRRTRIDAMIEEASKRNDRVTTERSTTTRTAQREYQTKGQDPDNATTELSFQVVTPVNAQVHLEDVSLAWCPRIVRPFKDLQRHINMAEYAAVLEYYNENQLFKPQEPDIKYGEDICYFHPDFTRVLMPNLSYWQRITTTLKLPGEYYSHEIVEERCLCTVHVTYFHPFYRFLDEAPEPQFIPYVHSFFYLLINTQDKPFLNVSIDHLDDFWINFWDHNPWGGSCSPETFIDFHFTLILRTISDESRNAKVQYEKDSAEYLQNDAARNGRANQYARMRRNEMIALYSNSERQKDLAFTRLVNNLFSDADWSYYRALLKSCLDWVNVQLIFEPSRPISDELCFPYLPPDHLLNACAVRLILPIRKDSERAFFDAMDAASDGVLVDHINAVKEYIKTYRHSIALLQVADPEHRLLLDSYRTELVLGRHCEAVLSRSSFAE